MKKLMKRIGAVLMAVAMMAALGVSAWADTNNQSKDGTITVSGLDTGDTVAFYKVLEFSQDATTTGGWVKTTAFTSLSDDIVNKVLRLGVYASGGTSASQGGISEATAAAIADIAETADATYSGDAVTISGGTATVTNPDAGLYVALVTPKQPGIIYNPVFVGADYKENSSNTWAIALDDLSYDPASMAKKGQVTLTKEAEPKTGKDTAYENDGAKTVAIGDVVTFTVKTTIPEFADSYTSAVFKVSDTLSAGLSLKTDTIKIYPSETATGDTLAATEGSTVNYSVTATAGDKDEAGSYEIDFKTPYLLGLDAKQPITITYDAEITSEAPTSVNVLDNTVTVNFSNSPTDNVGKGTLKAETKHYTFDIDADLLGETTHKTVEVVKVGIDKDGKEITETTEFYNGKSVGPLQGAEFKLYTNSACTDEYEYKGNEVFKNGATIISDANGRLTVQGQSIDGIRGLDAGTYYLKETKAPDGYIKAQDPVAIVITPTYKTTHKEEIIDGITVEWDVQELDSYTITIGGVPTATYTMSNEEKPNAGDTVVGAGGFIGADGVDDAAAAAGKIQNIQGVELPSTGGIGTYVFTVAGVAIMAIAAGLLIVRHKKKAE